MRCTIDSTFANVDKAEGKSKLFRFPTEGRAVSSQYSFNRAHHSTSVLRSLDEVTGISLSMCTFQDAMTLEEIKDQVAASEKKLQQLRSEKQDLVLQLKKMWNEDDAKRKMQQEINQQQMMQFAQQQKLLQEAQHHSHQRPDISGPVFMSVSLR